MLFCVFFPAHSLPKQGPDGNLGRVGEREETAGPEPVHSQVRMNAQVNQSSQSTPSSRSWVPSSPSSSISLSRANLREFRDSAEQQHIVAQQKAALQVRERRDDPLLTILFDQDGRWLMIVSRIPLTQTCFCSMLTHIHQGSSSLKTPRLETSSSLSSHAWNFSHDPPFPLPLDLSCNSSQGSNRLEIFLHWLLNGTKLLKHSGCRTQVL